MNIDFQAASKKSLVGIDADLTKLLKEDARTAGWPLPLIKTLKVAVEEFKVVVYYPEKYEAEIENLEYGTEDSAPLAVFRRYMNKHGNIIFDKLANWSVNLLVEKDVFP
jgi:hypothetical protein